MRASLHILLTVILVLVPISTAVDYAHNQEQQHLHAAEQLGTRFDWPAARDLAEPADALETLTSAAAESGVNVLRVSIDSSGRDRRHIHYYVYLGGRDTQLFDIIKLSRGNWPSASGLRHGQTATTIEPTNPGVVGVPNVVAGRYDLSVEPLETAYNRLPAEGTYTVEAPTRDARDEFLQLISGALTDMSGEEYKPADLNPVDPSEIASAKLRTTASRFFLYAPYLLTLIAAALIPATVTRAGRQLGVLSLHGYPNNRIWYTTTGRPTLITLGAGLGVTIVLALTVPEMSGILVRTMFLRYMSASAAVLLVTYGVGMATISRFKVSDLVKGRL